MTPKQFFHKVAEMRYAQQNYFRTKSQHWLLNSKMYEKEVDAEIARVKALTEPKQGELFTLQDNNETKEIKNGN